ncbi:MAG: AAA family ATPase [Epsilonproteobacteria bacterium]|nr:AAA family ATPase [Campylobacterota bacterium]
MIEKFYIKNFKNLLFEELKFSKINILIGANGSGKSNFIDGIVFFRDLLKYGLQQSIAKRKFEEILNKYNEENSFAFNLSLNTEKKYSTLRYEAEIFIHQMNTFFLKENISYDKATKKEKPFNFINCHNPPNYGFFSYKDKKSKDSKRKKIRVLNTDTVFRQSETLTKNIVFATEIFPMFSRVIDDIKEYVNTWRYFPMSDISLDEFKKPLKITGKRDELNSNLNNISDFFYNINTLIPKLQRYIPGIEFSIDTSGEYMQVFPIINGKKFLISSLSDGELRILLLMTIFYLDTKSKVVFLDEPELNLHPSWLLKLRDDMLNSNKQLFISTHSADLLDTFTEDFIQGRVSVFVFEKGRIKKLKNTQLLLNEFERGYELGDLYRSGDPVIGGWY